MSNPGQLVKNGHLYTCGDVTLSPDPPEHILVELYNDWKESGVLDWTFYGEPTSLLFFLQWFTRPKATTLGVYHWVDVSGRLEPGQGVPQPVGLVWINETFKLPGNMGMGFSRAEVAMAFRRGFSPEILHRAGAMAAEWGFSERGLDALIGTTPVKNRAAVAFGRSLGFTIAGPVHGMCVWHGNLDSVMLQSMTKDQWGEISPFREKEDSDGCSTGI